MGAAGLDESTVERVRSVCSEHGVSFAMLFGSAARGSMDEGSDVDVVVEFDDYRPDDAGYSDVYLRLRTALEAALSVPVDVVDVHSMAPQFAHVAFDEGVVILGSESRKAELAETDGDEEPTLADARDRVSAAVERLQDCTVG